MGGRRFAHPGAEAFQRACRRFATVGAVTIGRELARARFTPSHIGLTYKIWLDDRLVHIPRRSGSCLLADPPVVSKGVGARTRLCPGTRPLGRIRFHVPR